MAQFWADSPLNLAPKMILGAYVQNSSSGELYGQKACFPIRKNTHFAVQFIREKYGCEAQKVDKPDWRQSFDPQCGEWRPRDRFLGCGSHHDSAENTVPTDCRASRVQNVL